MWLFVNGSVRFNRGIRYVRVIRGIRYARVYLIFRIIRVIRLIMVIRVILLRGYRNEPVVYVVGSIMRDRIPCRIHERRAHHDAARPNSDLTVTPTHERP